MSLSMAETTPEVEEEVRRYAGLLKQAIRAAGLSVSEVERRLGAGPKEEFFAIAARPKQRPYAAPHHPPSATDFLAAFQRAGFRGDMTPLDEVDPASPEEFDRLVEDAVNRVLERRRREGKAEPLGGSPLLKGDSGGEGDL
jgi:hypothetical protein